MVIHDTQNVLRRRPLHCSYGRHRTRAILGRITDAGVKHMTRESYLIICQSIICTTRRVHLLVCVCVCVCVCACVCVCVCIIQIKTHNSESQVQEEAGYTYATKDCK